ncbi:MAG: HAD-IA family hydrolase [Vigna little leaf phytoplasma]|nr:HAD-IA family hydrolase [Vigna little leaf phytoplasma]
MMVIHKYLPKFYFDSLFDIPYDEFYQQGIKVLLFDLDNTLILPNSNQLDAKTELFLNQISLRFRIGIISNATKKKQKRVLNDRFCSIYLKWYQKKPAKWGFIQFLKLFNVCREQVVMIGDQLTTDILGANKMEIISILVKPLNRLDEFFLTKWRRFLLERPFISKIKKNNPLLFQQKFKNFIK